MLEEYQYILTPDEAAEILRVGTNRIYELLHSGELPAFRTGRMWKIPKDLLIEYVKKTVYGPRRN